MQSVANKLRLRRSRKAFARFEQKQRIRHYLTEVLLLENPEMSPHELRTLTDSMIDFSRTTCR